MVYVALTPLQKNSVPALTTSLLSAVGTEVEVDDQSVFYRNSVLLTKGWVLGPDNATDSYTEEITVSATDDTTGAGTVTISARAVKADGTNGAAREWAIGTTIKNTYTTGVHDQVIDNFEAAVGTWAAFDATPVWPDAEPTISSTVARYVRNGNVVTFGITYLFSDGKDAALPTIPLPVAASQTANYHVPLTAVKQWTIDEVTTRSDPFAYIDFTEETPVIKFGQAGSLPTGHTAELRISGSYEVA